MPVDITDMASDSVADLNRAIKFLKHLRDAAELGPSHRRADGVRALQLTDPWGNTVEVVDRAPGAAD